MKKEMKEKYQGGVSFLIFLFAFYFTLTFSLVRLVCILLERMG